MRHHQKSDSTLGGNSGPWPAPDRQSTDWPPSRLAPSILTFAILPSNIPLRPRVQSLLTIDHLQPNRPSQSLPASGCPLLATPLPPARTNANSTPNKLRRSPSHPTIFSPLQPAHSPNHLITLPISSRNTPFLQNPNLITLARPLPPGGR
jgi:hypothetical protein